MAARPDGDSLAKAIRRFDRVGAVALAEAALDAGEISIPELYDLLAEVLVDAGAGWQKGTVEVWQEHLITGIARAVVEVCASRLEQHAPRDRRATVLLAAPDNEYHDLGLRMLADRFTLAGWRSHFLGAAIPVREVIKAVGELHADAVALSASTHYHRLALRSYVGELTRARPDVRVWVGGPAFALEAGGWPAEMLLDPRSVPTPEEM